MQPASTANAEHTPCHGTLNAPWRWIIAGWLLLTMLTLPAVQLTSPASDKPLLASLLTSGIFLLGIYLPWALVTPMLWRLCNRWPLGLGKDAKAISALLLTGVLAIPVLSTSGWLLGFFLSQQPQPFALPNSWQRAVLATSLFALPTYFAVIGIGQSLAYVQRYRRRGELLAKARQEALSARLNHHFLFNALNAIGSLGYRDAARADAALAQLGDLLRNLLDNAPLISLREEVANIMAFVELQQLLQDRPQQLQLSATAAAWQATVPTLLLQPFIDNALRFAAAPGAPEDAITLAMDVQDDILEILLTNPCGDAGAGLGIGLQASRERLQALHGARASIWIQRDGPHCRTWIRLPLQTAAEAA
ncbi:sensor histidine kinase [Stenotrophomonas humi]